MVVRLICSDYDGTPPAASNHLQLEHISEDDVKKFLPIYLSSSIVQSDPFEVLDQKGMAQLIKLCPKKSCCQTKLKGKIMSN
ncbi:hypothetical protein HN51_027317 [Arachis hypogaea]